MLKRVGDLYHKQNPEDGKEALNITVLLTLLVVGC